jgi:hypothetical protein
MVVWILIAAGTVALFGLAWWSSGRASGGAGSTDVRAEGDAKALRHYSPPPMSGGEHLGLQ